MPEPRTERNHYPALDGLRGVAALMIILHHFLQLVPAHGRVLSALSLIFGFAWSGVDLFFVLSGFLITGILADAKGGTYFFRTFYGRRVLRIFPLYYLFLTIVLFGLPAFGVRTGVQEGSEFALWSYTTNFYLASHGWFANYFSHLWTLAIEEQFYFIWPLVIYLVRDLERLRMTLPWGVALVLTLRLILFPLGFGPLWLDLNTLTHCDGLILGGYLALSARSKTSNALRGFRPSWPMVVALVGITLFLTDLGGILPSWDSVWIVQYIRAVATPTALSVLFVWLLYAAAFRTSGRMFRVLSHRLARWFGKYSYGLYVWHVPIAFLVLRSIDLDALRPAETVLAEAGLFIAYVGGCIAVAFISWHLFEKHFLQLKRFLPYEQELASQGSLR